MMKNVIRLIVLTGGSMMMNKTLAGIEFKTASYSQESYIMCVFTIDCDYEELVEAIDLDYIRRGSDLKVRAYFDSLEELRDYYSPEPDEFCSNVFNYELAESCSKAVLYKQSERL